MGDVDGMDLAEQWHEELKYDFMVDNVNIGEASNTNYG
jgi:hypothetical protein